MLGLIKVVWEKVQLWEGNGDFVNQIRVTCTEISKLTSQKTKSMHIVKTY